MKQETKWVRREDLQIGDVILDARQSNLSNTYVKRYGPLRATVTSLEVKTLQRTIEWDAYLIEVKQDTPHRSYCPTEVYDGLNAAQCYAIYQEDTAPKPLTIKQKAAAQREWAAALAIRQVEQDRLDDSRSTKVLLDLDDDY